MIIFIGVIIDMIVAVVITRFQNIIVYIIIIQKRSIEEIIFIVIIMMYTIST